MMPSIPSVTTTTMNHNPQQRSHSTTTTTTTTAPLHNNIHHVHNRPTPKFFAEPETFSTKKEKGVTPRSNLPPRPPTKSCPPVSRVFQHVKVDRPCLISFKDSQSNDSLSPCYDSTRKELYFHQCFTVEKKIGAGSFGDVYRVRSKENGQLYAVKRSKDRFRGEMDRKRKLREVSKHELLPSHPNCVRFYRAWEEKEHLYIQTELCETSLAYLSASVHDIPEKLIWNYLVDLLMAIKHLQDHDLLHMDIKPDNIFITKDGTCKLGDFGLILDLSKDTDLSEAQEGDPKYLAPELMDGHVTKAADVFSIGISILELACDLDVPRGELLWHQLREGVLPAKATEVLSNDLVEVIRLMMEPNHQIRPTAQTLLELPCIRRHLQWKRWEQILVKQKNNILWLLSFIWVHCTGLFYAMTGQHPQQATNIDNHRHRSTLIGWDSSLSDDDVFQDEAYQNSISDKMGLNFSSSSESAGCTFDISPTVLPAPKSYTTGAKRNAFRSARTLELNSPVKTPSQGSPMLFSSSRSSHKSDLLKPDPSSTTPPSCRKKMTFDEEEPMQRLLPPKNLLSIFDMADSDDD